MQRGGSDLTYFSQKATVLETIHSICLIREDGSWIKDFEMKFDQLNDILSKYQEQPLLLNSALTEMISPISNAIKTIVHAYHDRIDDFQKVNDTLFPFVTAQLDFRAKPSQRSNWMGFVKLVNLYVV